MKCPAVHEPARGPCQRKENLLWISPLHCSCWTSKHRPWPHFSMSFSWLELIKGFVRGTAWKEINLRCQPLLYRWTKVWRSPRASLMPFLVAPMPAASAWRLIVKRTPSLEHRLAWLKHGSYLTVKLMIPPTVTLLRAHKVCGKACIQPESVGYVWGGEIVDTGGNHENLEGALFHNVGFFYKIQSPVTQE